MHFPTLDSGSDVYQGFEQGPVRPPSEARSLLIRITRNCPWNKCTFCPIYKRTRFSRRPTEHVKKDIDLVHKYIEALKQMADENGHVAQVDLYRMAEGIQHGEIPALQAAIHWYSSGMRSVFLQDANSLIIKPANLVDILNHLKKRFPWVDRITSYARSHTIARITDEDLKAIREAGLDRIHIGLESGSDRVLKMVKKGSTKNIHIKAGRKVVNAGMELSEYVMPGLGGRELSEIHALETADALNQINPHFIRIRTLAIPNGIALYEEYTAGRFQKPTDLEMVEEILLFIECLEGITSIIQSDHILNLFEEVEGRLPEDKERMMRVLRSFLSMDPEYQCLYQVGRRIGVFSRLEHMESPHRLARVEKTCREHGITPENVNGIIEELVKRFI